MSFPQRLSGVFLALGMTFFFCCFRKKMYPLKNLFGVWEKTQVRFTSNASTFYFKRKYVLLQTQVRFTSNASAFNLKRKGVLP